MDKFKCNTCGEEKDVSEFYKKKDSKLGHEKICNICFQKRVKKNRQIKKSGGVVKEPRLIIDNKTTCSNCKEWKHISEFYENKKSSIGLTYRCKECMNVATSASENKEARGVYQKQRKIDFYTLINNIKNVSCMDCGNLYPPQAMDFDHVRGIKEYNIDTMRGCNLNKILNEIAKCDVICSNCYRVRTKTRIFIKNNGLINGSKPSKKLKQWVDDLKKDKACMDCSKFFMSCAMDWDHVAGIKLFNVSSLRQKISIKNKEVILKEIEKCELVCSNCHRIRTRQRLITNKKTFY